MYEDKETKEAEIKVKAIISALSVVLGNT